MIAPLPFELTPEQIQEQYELFRSSLREWFPTRIVELEKMYDVYEDRIILAPASGVEHYHNAFPGGYLDHILRVVKFSELEYKIWNTLGFVVDNFTLEELRFAAVHHDLGKLGLPNAGGEVYVPNTSELWHYEKQGKVYFSNETQPFSLIQDASLFILQRFGIMCSHNEWYAIRVHDGVYDDANKKYYINNSIGSKFRCNMPMILHEADNKAARWEYERWAKCSGKFKFSDGSITSNRDEIVGQ